MYITSTNNDFAYGTIYGIFIVHFVYYIFYRLTKWWQKIDMPTLVVTSNDNKTTIVNHNLESDKNDVSRLETMVNDELKSDESLKETNQQTMDQIINESLNIIAEK